MNLITHKADEELVDLIRNENLEAFNEIYNRYWKILLAKSVNRLKSKEDAEEVIQELFVNLWRRRARLQLRFTFRTYIHAALKYEILNHLTKRNILKSDLAIEDPDFSRFLIADESFFSIEIKELQLQIDTEINKLPEKCRLIFKMSRNDGMTAKDIADKLEISARTVETQIGRALKILRKSLSSYIFFL